MASKQPAPRQWSGFDRFEQTQWGRRAERLLEKALDEVQSGTDAIPTVSAVLAALRIEAGELPASEMDNYPFPDEDDDG